MNEVLLGLLLLLACAYRAVAEWSPDRRRQRAAGRRRREARAVRRLLLAEISAGQRSFDDAGVHDLLAWCRSRATRPGRP